ncbi:DUF2793 domain-containing protein [Zavarzinia compransoris]|uniref:DUF2793 domain-containing protein n=1 Tax=Zavarzinia marina TaxID=2911065 RepID=UPI001F389DE2|nr:DUF2793 domain-containing protein [Zavarzinia marina]MCF4166466.1 DUF2793 domain-containing protein [Zavarzinia marina]
MATPRLAMPYIVQSQAQKEVTHNEALNGLDLLVQAVVLDRDRTAPPEAPAAGQCHIVGPGATGAWAGRDGQLAGWYGTAWRFHAAFAGMIVHVAAEGLTLVRGIAGWAPIGVSAGIAIADVAGLDAALDGKLDDGDAALFATASEGALATSALQPAAVGTTVQAHAGRLDAVAAATWAADRGLVLTGADTIDSFAFTPFMRGLMASAAGGDLLAAAGALPLAGGVAMGGSFNADSTGSLAYSWSGGSVAVNLSAYSDNAIGPILKMQKARGTGAAPVAVQKNDLLFRLSATAYDGSSYPLVGEEVIQVISPVPASGDMATRWRLRLCPLGSASLMEVARFEGDSGLSLFGANCVISADRLHRLRVLTVATLSSVTPAQGDLAFVADLGGGGGVVRHDGAHWARLKEGGCAVWTGDADFSLAALVDAPVIRHTATLTAGRGITLSTLNAAAGTRFHIVRTGGGAFPLDVGGLRALATGTWCAVEFDGAAWRLLSYGSL